MHAILVVILELYAIGEKLEEKPKGQIKEFDSDVPCEWKPIYVLLCDIVNDA